MASFIRASIRHAEQPEVLPLGKTLAEALIEEGYAKGFRQGALLAGRDKLLRQLRLKFKRVPAAITAEVEATEDVAQLDVWLGTLISAEKISEIPFQAGKKK